MKIKQYAAFALIGLALSACNKPGGEGPDVVEPEGKLVKAKLAISIPKSVRTYALPGAGDALATDDEIHANHIDVFIYDDGGSYALKYERFTRATVDFDSSTDPADGEFKNQNDAGAYVTGEFDVREGKKLVYVGINLPDLIVERLKTGYYVNEIYEQTNLIDELVNEIEAAGSGQVAFFNTAIVRHNIGDPDGGGPLIDDGLDISVSVSRLVAKVVVGVDQATSWDVNGGTIAASSLYFAIGQRNNQMFVSPLVGGADPNYLASTIPNVLAASALHPTIQKLQFVTVGDPGDYIQVNGLTPDAGDGANTNMRYATENTSDEYRHQDVTYVSVRAKFIPHRYNDVDPVTGELPDDGTANNTAELTLEDGFYAVFTGDPDGDDALGVRYFDNIADARAFVIGTYFTGQVGVAIVESTDPTFDEDAPDTDSDHYIFFYEDSWCYYRIYLNSVGDYDILRNTVYLATITGINYIGTTKRDAVPGGYEDPTILTGGRGTPTYPGDWFPNNLPGFPILPTAQISPTPMMEDLNVTITVEDWDDVDEGNVDVY